MSRALEARSFRANPHYELVLLDRLAPAERAALGELEGDTYGLLRPRPGSGLELRPASMELALLFLTLRQPQTLPAYVGAQLRDELDRSIGRLVLDGVLEVEHQGAYLCGAEAGGLVVSGRSEGGRGRIGELSVAALRYAQDLGDLPASLLGLRLYLYGRQPVSPELQRRLPDDSAVASYLGIAPGGAARAALDADWLVVSPMDKGRRYWRTWRPRSVGHPGNGASPTPYKLYVSPAVEALDDALRVVACSLARAPGVGAFKVGGDLPGICRPDKLVVYFHRLDDLQQSAALLCDRLDGCPAHGVPFTAPVTADGLFSWGADPPPSGARREALSSWRMWVSERLAEYLVVAREGGSGALEPWQFARERLRLSGIDTDTWAPAAEMWPTALASA